jgi:hypothetical protein
VVAVADLRMSITILSLGAGVQSTTVLLMADRGEIERPVEAIFADTGWEPAAVYAHLDWLRANVSIPIVTVSAGNLRGDALASNSLAWMPMFVKNADGGDGMLRRQCTTNYKIAPIRRRVRELMAEHGVKRAVQQFGISLEEAVKRMRTSDVKYLDHSYPLVDRRMTRDDCKLWLVRNGYPVPPKSSCVGCPLHNSAHWADMKRNRPDEWADAVAFDEGIRDRRGKFGGVYLHRQRIPLRLVALSTPGERGQLSLFDDECHGVCGV